MMPLHATDRGQCHRTRCGSEKTAVGVDPQLHAVTTGAAVETAVGAVIVLHGVLEIVGSVGRYITVA